MFDINFLITEEVSLMLDKEKNYKKKAQILVNLTTFEENYPELSEEISTSWYGNTGKRYAASDYFLSSDDKSFILEYAEKINDFDKVKQLINKLCSISDGVYNYDEIMADAENEINVIADISSFEFSDSVKNEEKPKKTSLDALLSRKM